MSSTSARSRAGYCCRVAARAALLTFDRTARLGAAISLALLGCLAIARGDETKAQPAPQTDPKALDALERRTQEAAKKVLPTVVAVEVAMKSPRGGPELFEPFGSGVIITPEGLILSQYHVSHALVLGDWEKSRKPGERLKVILHDGTRRDAELLGADRAYDVSLLRLVDPGPYPHAPLDGKLAPKLGDGVLKLGHPQGYRRGRAPVVRLGRVLYQTDDFFASDCVVAPGDSGGPLFDLDGRLLGIIRNSGVPQELLTARAKANRANFLVGTTPNSVIAARLDALRRGEFVPAPKPAKAPSRVEFLPVEQWSQGPSVLAGFRGTVESARLGVVTVLDGEEPVALGTVVSADGHVVTMASLLPDGAKCRLPDGKVVAAEVIGADPAFDLVLLKVPASGLQAVVWAEKPAPAAGTLLAAAGPEKLPRAIGVVGVPRRDLPGPFPTKILPYRKAPAALPEVIGSAVQGRGYWVEFVEGRAAAAGLQPGDIILTIAGTPVRSHQDLATCVRSRMAGERVTVRVNRAGKPLDLTMALRPDALFVSAGRQGDFPTVVETDLPLAANEEGGPVVDLRGRAVGITLGRTAIGALIVPADCVQKLLPDLKSGKLSVNRAAPPPSGKPPGPPKSGGPVAMTLDELKQRLEERTGRFKSLLVEYDVVAEADIEPMVLMSWQLFSIRDYQERHTIAFAGDKRYTRVLLPGIQLKYAPDDAVAPDRNAPPEVARAVEQAREGAAARKARGDFGYLVAIRSPEERRSLFDGKEYFIGGGGGRGMSRATSDSFYSPFMYLCNLGLRPLDPKPAANERKSQQQFWFPENFGQYTESKLLPTEEFVDGAGCVVLEAQRHEESAGRRIVYAEKIWFDPKLGFVPRRWEQRVDGHLASVRTSVTFEEFAPGCWLPWECTWSHGAPPWAAPEFRDKPAYTYHMKLRKARVNDVAENTFKP